MCSANLTPYSLSNHRIRHAVSRAMSRRDGQGLNRTFFFKEELRTAGHPERRQSSRPLTALADPTRREIARPAPVGERQVSVGHGRLRCFQSCVFHLIVVAVQRLPVCIHKVHLAVAGPANSSTMPMGGRRLRSGALERWKHVAICAPAGYPVGQEPPGPQSQPLPVALPFQDQDPRRNGFPGAFERGGRRLGLSKFRDCSLG
jgi:hypothetical protein